MVRNIIISIVVIMAIGFCQTVYKAGGEVRLSPRLLNYQGYLTDTLGNPITNSSVSMTFAIFDAVSAGNQKWTETQGSVSVDKGIFHVLLGSVTPIPDSVFNNTNRWLQLSVGGQTLSPRTRIVSTPYAYTATYSDTAQYSRVTAPDRDWTYLVSDGADTTLQMGGCWGVARAGNVLWGNADSTHVNFGVACTTGLSSGNFKYCTVSGGLANVADDFYSTVGGGNLNTASGSSATIGGGVSNAASGISAAIGGGYGNAADTEYTTVSGGRYNVASGYSATVGGGYADTVNASYGGILAGYSNLAGDASSDTCALVSGGWNNSATANFSAVASGRNNTASGLTAAVVGGSNNIASSANAFVGGGSVNLANGYHAVIDGGYGNTASGNYATVGGGENNQASAQSSTVAGGSYNTASGSYSFAAGRNAKANRQGSFVWGDNTNADVSANADNRWVARCSGGVYFYTNAGLTSGMYLAAGGSSWNAVSDRNLKENFRPIDGAEVLNKLATMPITTWNYKSQDKTIRHIGPMAQDFASFGVGESDKHINTLDADGIAFAAIQELAKQVQELKVENKELRQEIQLLKNK